LTNKFVGKDTPSITIVILSWNGIQDTVECLQSVRSLKYDNFRIVLVDNGSTDDTVRTIRGQFSEISIIENDRNMGYAEGNNIGIRYALSEGADYVLILNNDTIVDPLLLESLVSTAKSTSHSGIFSPNIYWYSQPTLLWFAGAEWKNDIANFVPTQLKNGISKITYNYTTDYACGCALFINTTVISKIGLFDSRFFLTWEEADLCYRARRAGYSIGVEPRAKIWHKVSRSFADGSQGAHYQYYYTRNRFLWIEKNLFGTDKMNAFKRCLREIFWHTLETKSRGLKLQNDPVLRAKLLGTLHYTLRRFGPGPSFN